MADKENWFVIYTRSRHEKLLAAQLEEAGYTIYLPLIKKQKRWSDRAKTVEVPLFNSYVFIRGISEKLRMKDFSSFVAFLQYDGRPAVVRPHEIEMLKTIVKYGYDVSEASDLSAFEAGARVEVIAGPLKGMSGELVSVSDSRFFVIHFENLGNSLLVKLPPRSLKILE